MADKDWYDFMKSNPKEWLEQEKANKKYHVRKQMLDVLVVLIFCSLIFFLAWFKLVGCEATSALTGLAIGYILSEYRNKAIKD